MKQTGSILSPRVLFVLMPVTVGLFAASFANAQSTVFKRGDVNFDELFNLSDAIYIAERLFIIPGGFDCEDSADVNDDGAVNLTDVIHAANFLFLDSMGPPPPPLVECGVDPTDDAIGCGQFPPCETGGIDCLDQDSFDEAFGDLDLALDLEICLPAGLLEIPVEVFEISVCPADAANPECGDTGEPGCAIQLTSFEPILELDEEGEERLGVRVFGRIDELPIDVTLGTTTTCLNDFHAEGDPDAPFSFDVVMPILIEENEAGERVIVGFGESSVENADIELDSSGGFACVLFGAAEGVLVDLMLQPLGEVLGGLTEDLSAELVGVPLCDS